MLIRTVIKTIPALLAGLLLFSLPAGARADDAARLLKEAMRHYAMAQFKASARVLESARGRTSDPALLGKINLYLGCNYTERKNRTGAREAFWRALRHQPDLNLAKGEFKPHIIKVFESVRKEVVGFLFILTDPHDAEAQVDGKPVGKTPVVKLPLVAGSHVVMLLLKGYKPRILKEMVVAGQDRRVQVKLVKEPKLKTVTPKPKPGGQTVSKGRPTGKGGESPAGLGGELKLDPDGPEPEPDGDDLGHMPVKQGIMASVMVGPAFADYGETVISLTSLQVAATGGYHWRGPWGMEWLDFNVHGTVTFTPVTEQVTGGDPFTMGFLGILGGAGVRAHFGAIYGELRLGLGTSLLLGADADSFLFMHLSETQRPSGAFASFTIRPSLMLGWTVWNGLSVYLAPSLEWSLPNREFDPQVDLLRFHLALGVGWMGS